MKRVAIVQSNYIPWRGYFDLISFVDTFVLYDDVQFTRRDFRNRNKIKTPSGETWLTIPVKSSGRYLQTIRQTETAGGEWAAKHMRSLTLNYKKAAYFDEVAAFLEPLYDAAPGMTLSRVNHAFIRKICDYIGIETMLRDSCEFTLLEDRSERLAEIAAQVGADCYVSGPAARAYLDDSYFKARGLAVQWFDYEGYAPYPQLWGDFAAQVSILDLLFNCGPDAPRYMRYARR